MTSTPCRVPECKNPSCSLKHQLCAGHLHRLYQGKGLGGAEFPPRTIPLIKSCQRCGKAFSARTTGVLNRKRFCGSMCAGVGLGTTRSDLLPSEHPTTIDIAWAAGLYEGEGSAGDTKATRTNSRADTLAKVGQKDPWILHRLKALFGGHIYRYRLKGGEFFYVWQVHGTLARGFLMTIYSRLSPRRRTQVRIALGHQSQGAA